MRKRISNKRKAQGAGLLAGVAAYLAGLASAKYGVPLEVSGPAATAAVTAVATWAAKLDPHG